MEELIVFWIEAWILEITVRAPQSFITARPTHGRAVHDSPTLYSAPLTSAMSTTTFMQPHSTTQLDTRAPLRSAGRIHQVEPAVALLQQ